MVGSDIVRRCARLAQALGSTCALLAALLLSHASAQTPNDLGAPRSSGTPRTIAPPRRDLGPEDVLGDRTVAEVRLMGNRTVSEKDIRAQINTRAGRPFDPALAQKDVRSLVGTNKFFDVRVKTQPGPSPGTV